MFHLVHKLYMQESKQFELTTLCDRTSKHLNIHCSLGEKAFDFRACPILGEFLYSVLLY